MAPSFEQEAGLPPTVIPVLSASSHVPGHELQLFGQLALILAPRAGLVHWFRATSLEQDAGLPPAFMPVRRESAQVPEQELHIQGRS